MLDLLPDARGSGRKSLSAASAAPLVIQDRLERSDLEGKASILPTFFCLPPDS